MSECCEGGCDAALKEITAGTAAGFCNVEDCGKEGKVQCEKDTGAIDCNTGLTDAGGECVQDTCGSHGQKPCSAGADQSFFFEY